MSEVDLQANEVTVEELRLQGNKALKNGEYETAIEHFTKGLEQEPENAILYSNRSAAYGALHRWSEALKDAQQAVFIRPEWAKAHSRVGLALYKKSNFEDAIQAYNTALKYDPSNSELSKNIATVQNAWKASERHVLAEELMLKGKVDQALPFFKEAVELDPYNALYWSNISHAYMMVGQGKQAYQAAEKVIQLRPQWHKGYQRKAEALYGLKKYAESAAVYATALQIEPTNAQLNSGFSKAHTMASKPPEDVDNEEDNSFDSFIAKPLQSVKNFFGI
mmetsp:Transcript_15810/g.20115  ORF Transcript_15810/g.20115 Transcript_15810/m.20115 type:complete len:278 (-) Transcript_15810:258-1091(-)